MHLRRNNKLRSEVSFDEPLNIDWNGNELLLSDVLGTEGDIHKIIEEEVTESPLHCPGEIKWPGEENHRTAFWPKG